jgi:hypothetical protein
MITILYPERITSPVPKRYPPEFRRKVLDLVAAGRRVAQGAADVLGVAESGFYEWRSRKFTSWAFTRRAQDSGLVPSLRSVGDCYWACSHPSSTRSSTPP